MIRLVFGLDYGRFSDERSFGPINICSIGTEGDELDWNMFVSGTNPPPLIETRHRKLWRDLETVAVLEIASDSSE